MRRDLDGAPRAWERHNGEALLPRDGDRVGRLRDLARRGRRHAGRDRRHAGRRDRCRAGRGRDHVSLVGDRHGRFFDVGGGGFVDVDLKLRRKGDERGPVGVQADGFALAEQHDVGLEGVLEERLPDFHFIANAKRVPGRDFCP